ncbi:MAG: arginine deiminase family protein [Bacteroidetes bacterium]|nr:arginine deiminase family protein [Bacteroidota bacterium]
MLNNEALPLKRVIVSRPLTEYFVESDARRHNIGQVADKQKTINQHDLLVEIMQVLGTEVLCIAELPGHPNSVFTKDTATVTAEGYIQLRMGLPTRVNEERCMAAFLDVLGEPCIGKIEKPGTVEGGDVILAGKVAFIGISTRTNETGARQIADLFEKLGVEPRIFKVPEPFLHLGGAMTLIEPDHVLCVRNVFSQSFFTGYKESIIDMGSFISGNVISLGNKEFIVEQRNISALEILEEQQFNIYTLDLSEFVKGNGGPSCLIMSLDRR